ncbi:ATP-grasp domain-containing protein [Rhodococcus sp. NM-2]|uniref:ATP-grasp domain-containing protein n=1 Tax=Rhodococcus sp. NM-2 TaxID=3401174 RepID=UPI003AAEC2F7
MAHILIVGGHDETFRMIEDLPVELTVFQNSESVTARQARRAHRLCVFDYRNQAEALSMAQELHEVEPVDAVVSFTEHGLMPAAVIKEALGIKGNAREAVRLTRDKIAMREHLAGRDLGAVLTRSCDSASEVRSFLQSVGGPIIVKPAEGAGSSGVLRVSSLDQVESAFACSRGEYPGPTLVEEFIDGPEYSVESFTTDGRHDIIAVTAKTTTGPPRYIETGHLMPAVLAASALAELRGLVTDFLSSIGHSFGPAHTEVRIGSAGPRIIEGNSRPGGDFIWELVHRAMGRDLVRESICHLAGLPPQSRAPGRGAGCVAFFGYENVVIERVQGIEAARQAEGVIRLQCSLEPGQHLGPLRSSADRQGVIVAVGTDLVDAERRLAEAQDRIRVETSALPH